MKIIKSMLPVSILNIIALFHMIQRLPATIAVHFTFGMQADRFADKWVLFAISFLPVIVSIILLIYLNTIERKEMMMSRKTENILDLS